LRHGDAYVLIMHSFAADLEQLSPGVVAIDQLITHLIDSGVRYCDFTTGNEAYKKQFGVSECGMRHGIDAVTARGRLFAASYRAARSLRAAAVRSLGTYARGLRRLRPA
jgi:CelD/BcsL family acetyltransferase involved in cellulose biosynthesis